MMTLGFSGDVMGLTIRKLEGAQEIGVGGDGRLGFACALTFLVHNHSHYDTGLPASSEAGSRRLQYLA